MRLTQKTKKNTKKNIIIAIAVLVLLCSGGAVSAYLLTRKAPVDSTDTPVTETYNRNDVNLDTSTDEQQKAGSDIKKESLEKEKTPQPTKTLPVSFTSVSQSDGMLRVRSLIEAVSSSGTCILTLTSSNGTTITKNSSTQALASNSTCQGFDVSLSELSKGSWKVVLAVSIDSKNGSATQTIEIK